MHRGSTTLGLQIHIVWKTLKPLDSDSKRVSKYFEYIKLLPLYVLKQ